MSEHLTDRAGADPDRVVLKAREICEAYGLDTKGYVRGGGEHPLVRHLVPYLESYDDAIRAAHAPGHTDLMISPESIDAFLNESNPSPERKSPEPEDWNIALPDGTPSVWWYDVRMGVPYRKADREAQERTSDLPIPTNDEKRKPTIAELEAILNDPRPHEVYMLPNGEVRARPTSAKETIPADDEKLIDAMCEAYHGEFYSRASVGVKRLDHPAMAHVLARIRPHIEAPLTARVSELEEQNGRLAAQVAEKDAALKPFAEEAAFWPGEADAGWFTYDTESLQFENRDLTVGDLRRARAALAGGGK